MQDSIEPTSGQRPSALRSLRRAALPLLSGLLLAVPAQAQLAPAAADLNDDGRISSRDYRILFDLYGVQQGEIGYRDDLDLNHDGVIDSRDYRLVRSQRRERNIATSPTSLRGQVFDALGNPLSGVTVQIDNTGVETSSNNNGQYRLELPAGMSGQHEISLIGATANDPTPGMLSGEFPSIPHKPVFINGGLETVLRNVSLPERDLTGSVDLREGGVAIDNGGNLFTLTETVMSSNGGVTMTVPAGCQVQFPPGENPVLSITRVDPSMLPIPMPPGLNSSLFVTYQPGMSQLICPAGTPASTTFENVDGYNPGDQQFLAGVIDGTFQPITTCTVEDTDGDSAANDTDDTLNCGPLPENFEFAWYHVDIPVQPCPRTTVVGRALNADGSICPDATVSVTGVPSVPVNADGTFSISNVPAGPNGNFCITQPFTIRASADDGADFGVSAFVPAVSGGTTNVGDIIKGRVGTLQGRVRTLTRITPRLVEPLAGADMTLTNQNDGGSFNSNDVTDVNGAFEFPNDANPTPPPVSPFDLITFFGGSPGVSDRQRTSLDFEGQVKVENVNLHGFGSVVVIVEDSNGNPVENVAAEVFAMGGDFGNGFVIQNQFCFDQDNNGVITIGDEPFDCDRFLVESEELGGSFNAVAVGANGPFVPMGPCSVAVFDNGDFNNEFGGGFIDEFPCNINQQGEEVTITVTYDRPEIADVGDVVSFSSRPVTGGEPGVVFEIVYNCASVGEDCVNLFDGEITIEIDADQDQNTGSSSEINFSPLTSGTNLGVEWRIRCRQFGFEGIDCTLFDATNSGDDGLFIDTQHGFIDDGFCADRIFITVTDAQLGTTADTIANAALLSAIIPFDRPPQEDVVPNSGNVPLGINSASAPQQNSDPLGDTDTFNFPQ